MNHYKALFITSLLVLVIGLGMVSAVPVGICCGDPEPVCSQFAACAAVCLLTSFIGIIYARKGRKKDAGDRTALREGFAAVLLAWISAILFGALPFYVIGRFAAADAIFETASGFSTTGATIIEKGMPLRGGVFLQDGLESLPYTLLYWRSLLDWMGGIGFVMFILMLLPLLGGGKQLYNAEVPGLKSAGEQLTPRVASTSRMLIGCYVLLTVTVAGVYRLFGMTTFDAVCHGFTTVATGGFSTHTASFGSFQSPALQWAAVFFMLVSACNFMLTLKVLLVRRFDHLKDEEFKAFVLTAAACTILLALQLHNLPQTLMTTGEELGQGWEPAFRTAAFQVVSVMSSTGYATSDYMLWGIAWLPMLILLLMVFGGCAGSTAGGLKFARLIVLIKASVQEVRRRIFPHLVTDVRLNGERLETPVVNQTTAFIVLYFLTVACTTLLLPVFAPMDLETALSAAISAISNVGPGLGKISPECTHQWMTAPAKLLLSFVMIAGRLELYTVFVVLLPRFWSSGVRR